VARSASTSYGVDPNRYIDSGTTDHITGDLGKLSMRERYNGHEQVHTASGACMNISHIGHSNYHTPLRNFRLKNILHIPKASKILISAHKLTYDNGVFIEIHPHFSLIKDLVSKEILHRGGCQGGLYPLPPNPRKQIFHVVKPTSTRWHHRLGHPSSIIIDKVVKNFSLPCSKDLSHESVCDACQKTKSCQLPYPRTERERDIYLFLGSRSSSRWPW
jgi:hypothetical protein